MTQKIKKIDKPWGHELLFARTEAYAGKVLFIRKGEMLSLQFHEIKEESMYISKGRLEVQVNDETFELSAGDHLHLPPKTKHRLKALEDSEVFEVSTPHLEDVVRLQDHYGRV